MKPQLPWFFAWETLDSDPCVECLRGILLGVALPWKIGNIESRGSHKMMSSLLKGKLFIFILSNYYRKFH